MRRRGKITVMEVSCTGVFVLFAAGFALRDRIAEEVPQRAQGRSDG